MTPIEAARTSTCSEDDADDHSPRVILWAFLAVAVWLGACVAAVLL